ncbi:hypothetical protein EKO27_g104 [Xylaria grammica]|uniref:3-oxoacyl-[acyl-carrier-protein] reductase n=1 Tax=Xylaria grammica TaxID=363999 RepID=A0A439DKU9_9PEZI|nr:hypothetical protein EKO27_g104 [Xylaria grammica]
MLSLRGKRCVITGGSRGIGLAIARLFASEGASCVLVGRYRMPLEAAVDSLPVIDQPQRHAGHHFNVVSIKGWDDLVFKLTDEQVDVLVNAAGISQNSLLVKVTQPEITELLGVNLKGTILGCQAVIPRMMKRKSGCIINVSSLLATHGGRGASIYAAAKAGVIGLTRSLAWEVGRFNIRANVIQPGYIRTAMTKAMGKDEELAALIPLGRLGLAEEVADAALFLANNSYAHNCVLNIDGGLGAM